MSSFCLCMLLAIAVDYILELTLFAPVLAMTSYRGNDDFEEIEKRRFLLFVQFFLLNIEL